MTAARVAHDMREYIEKHGWVQDVGYTSDGAVCLLGALCRVTCDVSLKDAFIRVFAGEAGTLAVSTWNDAPGRTYEDVILLLRQIEAES